MGGKNLRLYKKVSRKGYEPLHVAEVGVYHPETSNVYEYIKNGTRCTLVEPDEDSVSLIKEHFKDCSNITLFVCAVCDFDGTVELYRKGSSTFVSNLVSSPAIINDDYQGKKEDKFIAEAKTFDSIDDGSINLLSVDTEGSEWFVIKNLISRPHVISLETHGGLYTNPYINEILDWMDSNHYRLWYKDNSDSVFVLNEKIKITVFDRLGVVLKNLRLKIRRTRKKFKKKLYSWIH